MITCGKYEKMKLYFIEYINEYVVECVIQNNTSLNSSKKITLGLTPIMDIHKEKYPNLSSQSIHYLILILY